MARIRGGTVSQNAFFGKELDFKMVCEGIREHEKINRASLFRLTKSYIIYNVTIITKKEVTE